MAQPTKEQERGAEWEKEVAFSADIDVEYTMEAIDSYRSLDNTERDLDPTPGFVRVLEKSRRDERPGTEQAQLRFDTKTGEPIRYELLSQPPQGNPEEYSGERQVLDLTQGFDLSSVRWEVFQGDNGAERSQLKESRVQEVADGVYAHQVRWSEPFTAEEVDKAIARQNYSGPGAYGYTS